jgi:hypothetical protein
MQTLFSKNINNKLNFLGVYQILGGVLGLMLTIWLLTRVAQMTALIALLFLLAFVLYALSTCCGILLLGRQYSVGLKLSILNQVLQIGSFQFLGYAFLYISGCFLNLGIGYGVGNLASGLKMGFDFGLMSKWQLSIASHNHSFALYVNLVAIYLIYFIDKLRGSIKAENEGMVEGPIEYESVP